MNNKCVCCGSRKIIKFSLNNFELKRCINCNYIFKSTPPLPENDENYHNDSSGFYLKKENIDKLNKDIKILSGRVQYITSKMKIFKKSKILDISCGSGAFVYAARKNGFSAFGTEISKNMLNFSRKKFGNYFYDGYMDLHKKYKYDLITLFHVVEHVVDPKRFLEKEVIPLLNVGGCIVIEIPNFLSFDHFFMKEQWPGLSLNVHHNFLNSSSMEYLCKDLNLELVDTEYSNSNYMEDCGINDYIINKLKFNYQYYAGISKMLTGLVSVFYIRKII